MGFDNILESNGLGIAATGMVIVFGALTLITGFIYLLPKVLSAFALDAPSSVPPESSHDEEIAAVIGYVLHQPKA